MDANETPGQLKLPFSDSPFVLGKSGGDAGAAADILREGPPTVTVPSSSLSLRAEGRSTGSGENVVAPGRHGWTLAVLGAGLAIIAACVLVPAINANRQMRYEHDRLVADKEQVDQQIAVNDEFLKKMSDDPQLVERLAQRQMRVIPQGTAVLQLPGDNDDRPASPFALVDVAPAAAPAYQPTGGILADWCLDSKREMGLIAAGLFLVAVGLICGPANE